MNTTVVISVLASLFIGSHSVLGRVLHRISYILNKVKEHFYVLNAVD